MLARKQSLRGEPLQHSDFGPDDNLADGMDEEWVNTKWTRRLFRACALLSITSVSMNTPKTFEIYPFLLYITFTMDCIVTLLFTAELIAKIKMRGLYKGDAAYLKDRWCQFDGFMVICLLASVILQACEIANLVTFHYSILRSPRPFILIRVCRVFLKFQLPKTRIQSIFKRASQQVYNVTIFFLFFMSLYGILGVQFFGKLVHHCVRNGTNPHNVTVNDLAIPDIYCSPDMPSQPQCPKNMICTNLTLSRRARGFNGFDEFATSFFTVYEAASLEGWVFVMYRTIDSLPAWRGFFFFSSMIFFLAWLVKNVFIAVITETFAEIRVQFQQMWGTRDADIGSDASQILTSLGGEWKMITIDDNKSSGFAPPLIQRIMKTAWFHILLLLLVLANAIFTATMTFDHRHVNPYNKIDKFYFTEVVFTLLFDVEAVFKVLCLGFRNYIKRSVHKFELVLAFGTTLHIIPTFYRTHFTYFQVLRVVRLIKASPMLEDFCWKIFGPGKKLGSLILFTMCLLIITSLVSLQLFCSMKDFHKFATFPQATMSMFQILTQKGWNEVMRMTMWKTNENYAPLVAIYFILYHLFMTLIVVSLFVAVILDNLELDEDIKKLRQMKLREQVAETQRNLPLRLRIFEKFPDRPRMVQLSKISSDFAAAKMRDSILRQFVDGGGGAADGSSSEEDGHGGGGEQQIRESLDSTAGPTMLYRRRPKMWHAKQNKKAAICHIIQESHNQRAPCDEPSQFLPSGNKSLLSKNHLVRMERNRSLRSRPSSWQRKEGEALGRRDRYEDVDIKELQQKKQEAEMKRSQQEKDLRENHPYFDTPLFTVGRESRFRRICLLIVTARYSSQHAAESKGSFSQLRQLLGLVSYLDWFLILVTTLSCISMMLETPDRRVMNVPELRIAEYIFVVSMSIELLLKVLAHGIFFTPNAVVKDFGGIIDLFIYLVSVVVVLWMPSEIAAGSGAQILLILRCSRPLRIFILVPHMRQVVFELLRGFKEIFLVSVLLIVLMFIFASYGVQNFGGKLARCNDPLVKNRANCHGVFLRPIHVTKLMIDPKAADPDYPRLLVPRVWANPRNYNFDNIGNAMLALFEVLSLEGWLEVRDIIIERAGKQHGDFIHLFVFIGCMIGLTLFVGVVIANYGENKGTALLTVDQKRWLDLTGRIKLAQPLHIPPRPDKNKFRAIMYDITQHLVFKRGVAVLVLANCSLLSVPWNVENPHTWPLATVSAGFTFLFLLEVIMKMISLTPRGYWQSQRNRLDCFVTILGCIWMASHFFLRDGDPNRELCYMMGYIIIVLRFFTITGKHATLKMLMLTIFVSMFKSFFVIIGMFLLMLFYAFAGVILFGKVNAGENLGRHANFHTASNAISTLFRIVTGEDWNKIMHDCMLGKPYCTGGTNFWESTCGNPTAALVYFCTFYVIITYIVLNVLVAIIMENFSLFYSNEEDALLSYNDIRQFQNTWNIVDVNRKGMVPVHRVKFVLRLLRGRLEVDLEKDRLLFKYMCHELVRLHNGDDVMFHDVLSMLAFRSVDLRKSLQLEDLLVREELEFTIEEEVAKQTIRNWLDKCLKRIRAKEHSNIMSNLRATNEPLFTVAEHVSIVTQFDVPGEEDGDARKVERNSSAPLPGMLSAPVASRKFLTPTLSDSAVRPDKERVGSACGKKLRSARSLAGSKRNLADDPQDPVDPLDPQQPHERNQPTSSILGAADAVEHVHKWWHEHMVNTH